MSEQPDKTKAAFFCDGDRLAYVYSQGRRERVAELTDLYPVTVSAATFDEHADRLADIEVIFSTWGMPILTGEQIDRLTNLKAIFYGAGAVKHFAAPYLDRGVTVVSSWVANAIPVAEFTVAQILLAMNGYFGNTADCRDPQRRRDGDVHRGPGVYGETVALIGAGMIGRKVIELLKPFTLDILIVDPYLPDDQAAELGVAKASLADAFARAYVVSNHLPNLPALERVLNGDLFGAMRPGAAFINTGRGAQVDEGDLIAVLQARPDLTALLDVTWPEPPVPESPLYTLANVHLTNHIAGSMNDEVVRMADYAIDEFLAWRDGRPLQYAVTAEMLKTMA